MNRVAIGVDLGGTNCRAALIEAATGRILDEKKERIGDHGPDAVVELVARLVAQLDPTGAASGIGIGFAGMLRGASGVVANAPNFGWRDVDLGALLQQRVRRAVALHNDLDAIAFGEHRFGAGRGARDLICVYVGTGIGAGLVLDGRLYMGWNHLAGEIGHTKVVPGGRSCGCGQRGCIEAYASGANLAARAREELAERPAGTTAPAASSRAVVLAGTIERIHAGHVDAAARDGDAWACALWDEVAPLLGLVLANAVTLLNPSRLVLGGGVWEGAPDLRRRVIEAYGALVNGPSGEGVALLDSVLGDTAGVLGAAVLSVEPTA